MENCLPYGRWERRMKITTFSFCILGTMLGMWLADLGAWPSAGGIWVICIILAIDGAASAVVKSSALDKERHRTLSTPSLGRSTVSTKIVAEGGCGAGGPPPPKQKVNPFKVGDKVNHKSNPNRVGVITDLAVASVRVSWTPSGIDDHSWLSPEYLELICEKQS